MITRARGSQRKRLDGAGRKQPWHKNSHQHQTMDFMIDLQLHIYEEVTRKQLHDLVRNLNNYFPDLNLIVMSQ